MCHPNKDVSSYVKWSIVIIMKKFDQKDKFTKLDRKQNNDLHEFINLEVYKLCGNKRNNHRRYLRPLGCIELIDVNEYNNLIAVIKGKEYSFSNLYKLK